MSRRSEALNVAKRSEESLNKAYEKMASNVALNPQEEPEDVIAQKAQKDPWAWGVWASIRFTGFLKLLNRENAAVNVLQLMFALELTALNWFNAKGAQFDAAEVKRARKAAYAYYAANIDKV